VQIIAEIALRSEKRLGGGKLCKRWSGTPKIKGVPTQVSEGGAPKGKRATWMQGGHLNAKTAAGRLV